jgi:hypothetical protein
MAAKTAIPQSVHVTKEMLGNHTRKGILYLDQNFFSSVHRGKDHRFTAAMERVKELLDLQLLAIPYSSTHESEAAFTGKHRDALVGFLQSASRSHHFEPYWRVEQTQILKAFHAYLENAPASYQREERDALPSRVHEWDGPYSVSVFCAATDVDRKLAFKQQAIDQLLKSLPSWANKNRTFEQDMDLELSDAGRILVDSYAQQQARLLVGDFSALINSPIRASVVGDMLYVVEARNADPSTIGSFFKSKHFAEVPSQQLSARLFSAFKKRVREGMFPNSTAPKTRDRLSGFLDDVQHAATYAPYCDAFFTDDFMARLMNDKCVSVEETFGCKVFSVPSMAQFFDWLDETKSRMTAAHAEDLGWAYPRYRGYLNRSCSNL